MNTHICMSITVYIYIWYQAKISKKIWIERDHARREKEHQKKESPNQETALRRRRVSRVVSRVYMSIFVFVSRVYVSIFFSRLGLGGTNPCLQTWICESCCESCLHIYIYIYLEILDSKKMFDSFEG